MEKFKKIQAILLDRARRAELRSQLAALHPRDVARVINRLAPAQKLRLFLILDVDKAADVLVSLDEDSLSFVLKVLDKPTLSRLVAELESDEAADILSVISNADKKEILASLPDEDRRFLIQLLGYPEETAGGRMKLEFLPLHADETVAQALGRIRRSRSSESIFFITDRQLHLLGWISAVDLITSSPRRYLGRVMRNCEFQALLTDDQEYVARQAVKYDLSLVPVVDEAGVLKGIITHDDLMDVLQDESTEDLVRFGGMKSLESVSTPPERSALRRLPWLYLNLGTAFLAAGVVGLFQRTIQAMVVLAVVMPIVAGMGGNAGIQTVSMIIRSIALGELSFADARRALFKEVRVGLLTGLAVGGLSAILAWVLNAPLILSVLIFVSLLLNMTIATGVGALIPLGLKKLGLDPALASGITLTTITDCMGFLILLGLATLLMRC